MSPQRRRHSVSSVFTGVDGDSPDWSDVDDVAPEIVQAESVTSPVPVGILSGPCVTRRDVLSLSFGGEDVVIHRPPSPT